MTNGDDLLTELVATIGEAATLALIEARAGARLYVPENVDRAGELAEIVGPDAIGPLVDRFGREQLDVPLAKHWRAKIYIGRGFGTNEIATKLGITRSGLRRLMLRGPDRRGRRAARPTTPDLFAER